MVTPLSSGNETLMHHFCPGCDPALRCFTAKPSVPGRTLLAAGPSWVFAACSGSECSRIDENRLLCLGRTP